MLHPTFTISSHKCIELASTLSPTCGLYSTYKPQIHIFYHQHTYTYCKNVFYGYNVTTSCFRPHADEFPFSMLFCLYFSKFSLLAPNHVIYGFIKIISIYKRILLTYPEDIKFVLYKIEQKNMKYRSTL